MKLFVCLIGAFLIVILVAAQPQAIPLSITIDKTTSLIFPFGVRYVDRGTKDVLVQQVKEAENLLLVKAGVANFKATNLSVVTADGKVYSFDVSYDSFPVRTLVYVSSALSSVSKEVSFSGELMNTKDLESYAKGILDNPAFMKGIKDKRWDIIARVAGIYIKDNVIFYQIVLENQSPINYDIDFIRFYIRDKRKGKRTASQEIEVIPLYTVGNTVAVEANRSCMIVFALEKFTIPDAKNFIIQVGEKNGGRHLQMKVKNSKILEARILPAYRQ